MWFKVSNRKQPSEFPDIVVDDTALQVVTKQKYLGVILDNCLSWNHHVSHVCKKMLIIMKNDENRFLPSHKQIF